MSITEYQEQLYNSIRKMLEKIKNQISYIIHNITDVRVISQVVFGILVLLVSWSCVKAIQTNAELQNKIAKMTQENEVYKLKNENQKLKNTYLETDQFLELAARRQLGKAAPGEKSLIVPANVAMAHTIEFKPTDKKTAKKGDIQQPFYEQNLKAWRNFFFRSNN